MIPELTNIKCGPKQRALLLKGLSVLVRIAQDSPSTAYVYNLTKTEVKRLDHILRRNEGEVTESKFSQ